MSMASEQELLLPVGLPVDQLQVLGTSVGKSTLVMID